MEYHPGTLLAYFSFSMIWTLGMEIRVVVIVKSCVNNNNNNNTRFDSEFELSDNEIFFI